MLLLPDGGLAVAGRRMTSASWDSMPTAWIARFAADGSRVWSVEEAEASSAERVAVDAQGRVYAAGRSPEALWVRAYDDRGNVRWQQAIGHGSQPIAGLAVSATADEVWLLTGLETIEARRVSIDGVSEDTQRVLEYTDTYSLDTSPALAMPDGGFYFPWLSSVVMPASDGITWEIDDERDASDPAVAAAVDVQAVFASPVGRETVWRGEEDAITLTQDGQSVVWSTGEPDTNADPDVQWGLPWRDFEVVDAALAWFEGVEAQTLAGVLEGRSKREVIEALLSAGIGTGCAPVMVPTSCSEFEEAEYEHWVDLACQQDALFAELLTDAPATLIRALGEELYLAIEGLPERHPIGYALVDSLDEHGVVELAVALGHLEPHRDAVRGWLEAQRHSAALALLGTELYEANEACEFVAEVRDTLGRLGTNVPPARTQNFADGCEQLYELCSTGQGVSSMIPPKGYAHIETCSDEFGSDEFPAEECEEIDTRSRDDLAELATQQLIDACRGGEISWGEFNPEGNCGVLVANDEHTIEFDSAGSGRWVISSHEVSWTIEAP